MTDERSYVDIAREAWVASGPYRLWEKVADAVVQAVREREVKPWMEDNAALQNKLDDVRGRIPDELVELLRAWRARMTPLNHYADDEPLMDWCDEHLPPEPDPLDAWAEKLVDKFGGTFEEAKAFIESVRDSESAREAMRKETP